MTFNEINNQRNWRAPLFGYCCSGVVYTDYENPEETMYPVSYTHLDVYKRQEQGFGQLDQIFIVRVRHIEFHHGELWVMTHGDAFVTEVTISLLYTSFHAPAPYRRRKPWRP